MMVSEKEIVGFQKGSKPLHDADDKDLNLLKEQLFSTLEQARKDYKNGKFEQYNEYTVTIKSTLTNVEEALEFNNFHEGIHLGYVLALLRVI